MPAPKQLVFHDAARARLLHGIDTLAEAVRVTLGPRGRTVILDNAPGMPRIVNSGVVVARSIALEDPFENMGVQLLREVAARTSEMAGDGTTTATVLAHGMIHEGLRCLASGMNPMDLKRGMDSAVARVVQTLQGVATPCTSTRDIAHVASISANNDADIGALLAQAMERVGRTGAIAIEDGSGLHSVLEVTEGMQFERGFLSPYFINNAERQSTVLEDVAVLLCDGRLSLLKDLLPLLEEAHTEGRALLLLAEEVDTEILSALVLNTLGGALKVCAVKSPGFGEQRKTLLQDLAVLTGARVVSEALGLPLAKARLTDMGRVRRCEVDKDHTTLIGGASDPEALRQRIAAIRLERDASSNAAEREQLEQRASRLSGGVALIKVGAATETELKERRLRVEDALHATRAAVDEGVVPGGGVALLRARHALADMAGASLDETSGIRLVMRALEEPLRHIVANCGDEPAVVLAQVDASAAPAYGYNAASRSYGDLLHMGVMDPAKVTRLALQNAASIASLVLTTDCLVAHLSEGQATAAGLPGIPAISGH